MIENKIGDLTIKADGTTGIITCILSDTRCQVLWEGSDKPINCITETLNIINKFTLTESINLIKDFYNFRNAILNLANISDEIQETNREITIAGNVFITEMLDKDLEDIKSFVGD